jgi:predicted transcriptional regulator
MTLMATVPFSLRIDPEIKSELEHEAKIYNRSASYIATQAIKNHLQAQREKTRMIKKAVKQADEGVFVSEKAVDSWIDSWSKGEEANLPKPDVFLNK